MAKTKYGRHVIQGPFFRNADSDGWSILAHHDEYGANVCMGYHCIYNTDYTHKEPHTHRYHELLCFIGGNPLDITDFSSEIHICLGEEQEEHIITSPTIVSIPPGLTHCPLTVAKCDKPIIFLEISLTDNFTSSEIESAKEKREAEKKASKK